MDIFGLGKIGSAAVFAGVMLVVLAGAVRWFDHWIETGKEEAVEMAAQASGIEALQIEAKRIDQQSKEANKELKQLVVKVQKIQDDSLKLKSLMQRNWTNELQQDPEDFTTRANVATVKQLRRAQDALDESIASANTM